MTEKFIIYQLLPRVFGNINENCVPNGSLSLNGSGKFSDITPAVLSRLKEELHVTHVWYTGVIEHATKSDFTAYGIPRDPKEVIKGEAGSPYAIKDYYDVNPYLADDPFTRMEEFDALVERTHQTGLKVILDFVPNHLARSYHSDAGSNFGANDRPDATVPGGSAGFHPRNNFYYLPGEGLDVSGFSTETHPEPYSEYPAKVTGNDCFSAHPLVHDWYETVKLNYGIDYRGGGKKYFDPIPDTWYKMAAVLRFWAAKGVDGFRCDMAEMVPVEFWQWVIGELKRAFPKVLFIAEVYNPILYTAFLKSGKFDYLYDKVGLYDNLKAITQTHAEASSITGNWQALGEMQDLMLNFLENHDEQRIASDFNLGDPFKAIPALAVSLMLNNAPFMLYAGQEVGERGMLAEGFSGVDGRSSIFDYCSVPALVRLFKNNLSEKEKELYILYRKLFAAAMEHSAIRCGYTYDLEYANRHTPGFNPATQFVFARYSRKNIIRLNDPSELVLVAVDFTQPANGTVRAHLPKHLFDFWTLPSGKALLFTNLLTGAETPITLQPDASVEIPLTCGAGILACRL